MVFFCSCRSGQALASTSTMIRACPRNVVKVKLPARVACKSMNRVQKQEHRQRGIVKHALDTGQRSEMAESLLDALEGASAYSRGTGYFC